MVTTWVQIPASASFSLSPPSESHNAPASRRCFPILTNGACEPTHLDHANLRIPEARVDDIRDPFGYRLEIETRVSTA